MPGPPYKNGGAGFKVKIRSFLYLFRACEEKRIRGFNQAELLAKAIGRRMKIEVNTDILYRKRWTEPQKAVSGQERRHNLSKSMEIRHLPENLRRVMLIDDIYTTGAQ